MSTSAAFGNMASQLVTGSEFSYQNKRFVVCQLPDLGNIIMLSDVGYWVDHYDELKSWCSTHKCQLAGMTVEIPDDETLTMFCLSWS